MALIVDYQNRWPEEFATLAQQIRATLGDLALRVDHIGSTAIPNLAAKDVIDIQVGVTELVPAIEGAMVRSGWVRHTACDQDHIPPGFPDHPHAWSKRLFSPPPGQRRAHIHIRKVGSPNHRYPLLFRDYLRAHPRSAQAYAQLKRLLAEQLREVKQYAVVKDPAVDLIYFAAEDWARESGWTVQSTLQPC